MKTTLLLFDVDGTLLLSGGAGMRAMIRAGTTLFGDGFAWDGIETAGSLDPIIFREAAANNGIEDVEVQHERFRTHYLQLLPEELERNRDKIVVMPGIREVLQRLRRRAVTRGDVTLGLLTGNYTAAVPMKLHAIGIDPSWFTVTVCGDEGPSRADLAGLALQKYERLTGTAADPGRVIVIGDTPRDIACAHANGCVAFAVATGKHSIRQLQDANADYVAKDLADPAPLLSLLGQEMCE